MEACQMKILSFYSALYTRCLGVSSVLTPAKISGEQLQGNDWWERPGKSLLLPLKSITGFSGCKCLCSTGWQARWFTPPELVLLRGTVWRNQERAICWTSHNPTNRPKLTGSSIITQPNGSPRLEAHVAKSAFWDLVFKVDAVNYLLLRFYYAIGNEKLIDSSFRAERLSILVLVFSKLLNQPRE